MTCRHANGGCNYPEGECVGFCMNARLAASLEDTHSGKSIKEIWPNGQGLEIVFNDESSLLISHPFAFKPAPLAKTRS